MPGGDRTGPQGLGPQTGRAFGLCSGYENPGYANIDEQNFILKNSKYKSFCRNRGNGFGRAFGRCFGRRFDYRYHQLYVKNKNLEKDVKNEKKFLENKIKQLEEQIKLTKERIQKISAEK